MIDCTPSPTCTRVQPTPSNNGTPIGPPKRKKNVRVRKSIITDEFLSGGLGAIKVSSPKPHKKLNLIDATTNLKVHVKSTPSPKGEEGDEDHQNGTTTEKLRVQNESPQIGSTQNGSTRKDTKNYLRKSNIAKNEFCNTDVGQTEFVQTMNKSNMKPSKSLQNLPSTPKQKLDKMFYLQAIRSMKTRSMTHSTKENQEIKQIEDLLNSSTVLFEDDDQMEI